MIYIDDSIMQKDCLTTAGSKILENFKAPFDATVITRLTEDTERVKLAEFGMSDPGELPTDGMVLCNDVFGYVRSRAAQQGLCYIRPTYGTVSRFGLISTASSMDQIGVVCKDLTEGFTLLEKIIGHDDKDGVMFSDKHNVYTRRGEPCVRPTKGQIKDLPLQNVYEPVMQILAYAEISNNISRYDGIKFGFRASNYKGLDDLYIKTRTEAFGLEAKLAAIMGSLVLSQDYYVKYYEKAMKIRRLIKQSLRFDEYDILEVPVDSPLPQLTGLPSLTFGDIQWVANVKNESVLLAMWEARQL